MAILAEYIDLEEEEKQSLADLAQLGERQTEVTIQSYSLSEGPVFDPQSSHIFLLYKLGFAISQLS